MRVHDEDPHFLIAHLGEGHQQQTRKGLNVRDRVVSGLQHRTRVANDVDPPRLRSTRGSEGGIEKRGLQTRLRWGRTTQEVVGVGWGAGHPR